MTTKTKINRDELNIYSSYNIEIGYIETLLERYTKEQLLVCNSSHDGFYQVWLLAQLEGSVEELGVYHEHSPFRSDYNDIKDEQDGIALRLELQKIM